MVTEAALPRPDSAGSASERLGRLVGGGLTMDLDTQQVTADGRPVALQPNQFRTLQQLMRNGRRVLPPDHLADATDGAPGEPPKVRIYKIRLRLTEHGVAGVIKTVRGQGYLFDADVRHEHAGVEPAGTLLVPPAGEAGPGQILSVGEIYLDIEGMQLRYRAARATLTVTEFALLLDLMTHVGQIRPPTELADSIWQNRPHSPTALQDCLMRTRKRLAGVGLPGDLIRAVRRTGYTLDLSGLAA